MNNNLAFVYTSFEREVEFMDKSYPKIKKLWLILAWVIVIPLYFGLSSIIVEALKIFISPDDKELLTMVGQTVFYAIVLVILIPACSRILKESFKKKNKFKNFWKAFGIFWAFKFGSAFLMGILAALTGNVNTSSLISDNQNTLNSMMTSVPLFTWLFAVVFAPIIEEMVFRGVIFQTFRRFGATFAVLGSAFLFAFIHVIGEIGTVSPLMFLIHILPYLGMAIPLSWMCEKYKDITICMMVHMSSNLIAMLVQMLLMQVM